MAIQTRRGAYNDFDPEKMLPGEWASVTSGDPGANDGRSVYMCFAPGDVKRMATYTDMQESISEATEDIREQFTEGVESATQAATSAASQATAAASTAEDAADRANGISESIEQAVGGTLINDASASSLTVYSSKKSEETFVKKMDVIDIEHGGTGATYPVAARIALGAVGADDIIQISKGGTGGVTAQMAMTNIQNDPSVAWKTLSLAPGVEPGTYGTRPTPSYRKIGNHVKIEGGVSVNIPGTSPVLLATVPAGFRPLENVYVSCTCSGFRSTSVYLTTGGNLYLGWVFNLDSATRYTGDLSWLQIDMEFYIDGADVNTLGSEEEANTNASA